MATMTGPNTRVTPSGLFFTILLAGFIALGGLWWWGQRPKDPTPSLARLRRNEIQTFDNLRRIAQAQEIYFDDSKAIFGEARFAAFVTHLWTAVDPEGKPIRLNLIPEHLAVAVGTTKATDGYYFVDVRERVALPSKAVRPIDYRRQWTVAAIPQQAGKTGDLVFMVDQSGRIFARPMRTFSSIYALDPASDGWTALPTPRALSRLQ